MGSDRCHWCKRSLPSAATATLRDREARTLGFCSGSCEQAERDEWREREIDAFEARRHGE